MRFAIIESGVVTNIATAETDSDDPETAAAAAEFVAEQGWRECGPDVAIGWIEDGDELTPPPPAETTLAERKETLHAAVKAEQERVRLAGWEHDYGAAGTHRLDLRDADDKANWHLLLNKTDKMIAAGAGAMPVKIRTQANEQISVSASIANAAMLAFLSWGEDLLANKWDLDDAIDAAANNAALDAIDPAAGWP